MLARPGFARAVEEHLTEKYPHFLPRFPDAVRAKIVQNMLGRASLWGMSKQRPFNAYCEYMIAIAPNFDEEQEIRARLKADPSQIDDTVANLPSLVSDDAWVRAERNASAVPFFVEPRMLREPLEHQISQALMLIAADVLSPRDSGAALAWGRQAVSAYQLSGIQDAPLVLAFCFALYGPEPRWLTDSVGEGWSGRALLELARLRIALDFGRYV